MRSSGVGQFQRLLQLHKGGAARGQITGTATLVQGQRLARISRATRLHEFCLVAALRDADLHGPAAHLRQPGRQLLLILGLHRHQHGTRNIVAVQALLGVLWEARLAAISLYTCAMSCSMSCASVLSLTFSTIQPRWPRILPPRTKNT